MTTISWLMLFKEIITVYSGNHTKPTDTFCGQNTELTNGKVGGTYNYHRALNVYVSSEMLKAVMCCAQ
jgi:hypothetical protein